MTTTMHIASTNSAGAADGEEPMGIMVVKAYKIIDGKPADLRKLYEVWAEMRSA